MDKPGQHVLERSSVQLTSEGIEARFTGRSICGDIAADVMCEHLPNIVRNSLVSRNLNGSDVMRHIQLVEDQEALRQALDGESLAGFVRNDTVLPRASGASDEPMDSRDAVAFHSPESLERSFMLPNFGRVSGMAIPKGVTLIVGGGFHGKSTLLKALEVGMYNHIPGDGREGVVVNPSCVKIRAEDGRAVSNVDISSFINNLPMGKDTVDFSSPDASGSTSQAANIAEALEVGSSCLLIDEDTTATNFMIRDHRMQMLVADDKEPITPFIARVRELWERFGISTILVVGGAGDFFEVADTVIQMETYRPFNVTDRAKEIAQLTHREGPSGEKAIPTAPAMRGVQARTPDPAGIQLDGKISVRSKGTVSLPGEETLELSAVEQLVETSQTRFIMDSLKSIGRRFADGRKTLAEVLDAFEDALDRDGLDVANPGFRGGSYVRPRRFEIAAALNRLRTARFHQAGSIATVGR